MATNKYVDEYLKQNKAAMDEEIDLRKKEAAHQLQLLEEQNKLDVADTNAAYETAFRQNEVQRILNERYLDRKAAEMGLSSSGMNLTQQTANQLSYGNQKAALTADKQRAIQTLAQTMKARKYEVESARDADIGAIKSGYNASAYDYATEMAKEESEAASKYYQIKDNKNGEIRVTPYTVEEREKAFSNLLDNLANSTDDERKHDLIDNFMSTYNSEEHQATSYEISQMLAAAGFKDEVLDGNWTASSYADAVENGMYIPKTAKVSAESWNAWRNEGKHAYIVELNKDTKNPDGWLGFKIDKNDVISIYYPDGTPVVKKIKIKDLPKSYKGQLQEYVTEWTGQKDTKVGSKTMLELDLRDRTGDNSWKIEDGKVKK